MTVVEKSQYDFIQNEIWILTFGGAFQRANIYIAKDLAEQKKSDFKKGIRAFIESTILDNYKTTLVSDENHIQNIKKVSDYSANFSELFNNEKINFGIAQKMLNLYLKYRWSLGHIQSPPHFPVDRIIQELLNKELKAIGIKGEELKAWTQFTDEHHYIKVIKNARELILKKESFANHSLAELELSLFQRR
ncbi:hypothetical protein [Flavobacterium sp. TAB 87]|uniref:hypothetical protein n=1 Tax=Flavobacterium sp. TAB 87 TaxID=1729581 RepID=UPI00076D7185|nr:hypothetical protein [Flavobacterium sp. TAB 87]KVV16422.1 hypothetical protein AP058_00038 [Flavobacterium sp. TAB 87]